MKLSAEAKRLTIAILVITLLCIVIAAIYYRSWAFLPFMFGALFGGAASITKVFLLERAVDKALTMEKTRAGNYVILQHLLRFGITAVTLLLGALVPQMSLWGVVAGILAYKISFYTIKSMSKKQINGEKAKEVNDS